MVRPSTYVASSSSHHQPSHSLSPSISSATSSVGSVLFLPQHMNLPDSSYISAPAADAVVRSYPPPEQTRNIISKEIVINPAGLRTVNRFLDYILHEFLARAKSGSLHRLREAVGLVIRTTLGTAAMVQAEEDLADFLAENGDDSGFYEEMDSDDEVHGQHDVGWNLEKVWLRARTKCMVYSTLGDKDEQDFPDEEEEEEDYELPASKRKISGVGAVYLTAILEFIGEQCLLVAARTAYRRVAASVHDVNSIIDPIQMVVEDADVKRGIAEESLTTRLWRKWKRSEKILSTMSSSSSVYSPDTHRGSENHAENISRIPFTPAHAARELGRKGSRNSILSVPSMSRTTSVESNDPRPHSVPISPTSPTGRKYRHRRSKNSGESGSGTMRESASVTNIKETLGERGVMLPDSPHSPRADEYISPTSPSTEYRHHRSISEGSLSRPPVSPGVSSRGKEILLRPRTADDIFDSAERIDSPKRRISSPVEEDSLKTPTPQTRAQFFDNAAPAKKKAIDEDVIIVGGEAGLDYSIWETKTPVDQRFYFAPPTPKNGSIKSEVSYEILPRELAESRPTSSHVIPTVQAPQEEDPISDPESIEPVSRVASADADPSTAVEAQRIQVPQAAAPALIKDSTTTESDDEPDVIPGSWPKGKEEEQSEQSHSPSMSFEDVNDKIASQMAELERDRASVGLGLGDITTNGMSQVTVTNLSREPIILNRTELTPIMETASPRESVASDLVEQMGTPRIVTPKVHASSPPPTRHSSSSKKRATSPDSPSSSHSGERSRTASLTSQADRLRNKFLYRNRSPPRDLMVDTDAASPGILDRRNQFEDLIRSGETMKMTLTPTSLRSIENDVGEGEQRTIPSRVRAHAKENSTRELANFLRSTGPESFLGGTTYERRGSLPTSQLDRSPPQKVIRSVPSTPVMKNRMKYTPPPLPQTNMSNGKPVPRSPVGTDPDHSTLQLAAFLRTTGPNEAPVQPITLGGRNAASKAVASSIHSNGDSSTAGLLKYQSLQSQRYPPSPSTSTAYGTAEVDEDEDSDDPELSMYPGARRKRKDVPKEESLADFLRSTGPPEPNLPPSPTTPKNVRDKFTGGVLRKMSRSNVKSPEPLATKGVDIFQATTVTKGGPPPRVMSPTPSARTTGIVKQKGQYDYGKLNVSVPTSSFMGNDDYFTEKKSARSMVSRQNTHDPDEISAVKNLPVPNRSLGNNTAAREPVVVPSHTTDSLADFLRNTGPTDFGGPPPGKAIKKSKSGFFRRVFFGGSNEEKMAKLQRSGSVTSGRFTPITIPAVMRN